MLSKAWQAPFEKMSDGPFMMRVKGPMGQPSPDSGQMVIIKL